MIVLSIRSFIARIAPTLYILRVQLDAWKVNASMTAMRGDLAPFYTD